MTQTLSVPADAPAQDFGQLEDRDLTRRIVGFLTFHGLLRDASLVLKVTTGHVELRGTVRSFRQRERIDSFIRRVAGVHNVTNQLVVGTISITNGRQAAAGDDLFHEFTRNERPNVAPAQFKRGA